MGRRHFASKEEASKELENIQDGAYLFGCDEIPIHSETLLIKLDDKYQYLHKPYYEDIVTENKVPTLDLNQLVELPTSIEYLCSFEQLKDRIRLELL